MTEQRISILCWAGLALFTLYLLWVNHDYYRADTQTPTYDEAWYLETSLHLYHRLTHEGLPGFWDAYHRAFGVKAPLLSVLPIPFYLLLGPSRESAMLVNSLFIVLTNLYLFLLVRHLFSPSAGLAAVVFYQTMPLAYGLSRSFMAEYGLATLVIIFLYYLVATDQPLLLGVLLGLGLLMKVLFPAFIAGPLLLHFYRKRPWRSLPLLVLPALVLAATWYAYNWRSLLDFAFQSAYGAIAPDYTAGGPVAWLLLFVNQGISFYYAVLLLFAALRRPAHLPFLLSWLLPPLLAIALGRNQLIRFVLPLLPVFAIAVAAAVFSLGRRWILQAALALLLAIYPYRLFAALTYRTANASHAVTLGPFVVYSHDLGWARPPVHEDPWNHRRLLEALHRLAPDATRPFYVVLALDHTYLNANLLNYLNAYENYPIRFTSLGYAETSLDRALDRVYRLDARFLLAGAGFRGLPEFLNRLHDDLRARLDRGELPFHLRAEVPLAPPMKVLLYERDTPVAPNAQPSHPLPTDFPGGLRFLGYDWQRPNLTCYWTIPQPLLQDYLVRIEFPGHTIEYFLTNDRRTVSLPSTGPVEARLSLIPWGVGPAIGVPLILRLAE